MCVCVLIFINYNVYISRSAFVKGDLFKGFPRRSFRRFNELIASRRVVYL